MHEMIPFPPRPVPAVASADPVRLAYDALAPAYDALTADYRHDLWLDEIERLARAHGLTGTRVLDLACGTGKSFLPLLERGYTVTGCDLSPAMAELAAAKAPSARVLVADMRSLPLLGSFDLVTCLDDALNYLLRRDDLERTFAGIAARLAPGGLAVWDVNTLGTMRSSFASDWVADRGEWFLAWHGKGPADVAASGIAEARVDAFRHRGTTWSRSISWHRQRHWPTAVLVDVARAAGLEVLEILGQHRGARLEPDLDEQQHLKALFIARRRSTPGSTVARPGGGMMIGGI